MEIKRDFMRTEKQFIEAKRQLDEVMIDEVIYHSQQPENPLMLGTLPLLEQIWQRPREHFSHYDIVPTRTTFTYPRMEPQAELQTNST